MWQLNAGAARHKADGALYDRFASTILSYLCRQLASPQDAEDLLLEVFLVAFRNEAFASLPEERQLPWLRRVARNKVIDHYRHISLLSMLPLAQASAMEGEEATPEGLFEQQENHERLHQAVAQLSPLQQELIHLRYQRGLRLVEIAAMLKKPDGTLRKLLARTLQQLRAIYEQIERGNSHETAR